MRTLVPTLALLVLALALRLPHGATAEWKGDEAIQFFHERALAREGVLPARGMPTTDGPRLPVHFLYVLALPVVFSDSPEAVRVFMALLASSVIVSVFFFGRKDLGSKAALVFSFLLAVSPDMVRRGRWSWNPNLIPPLAAVAFLLLVRARRRPEGWAGAFLIFFGAFLPLIHYSLVGLGVLSLVMGLLSAKTPRVRLTGVVFSLLVLAPHVVLESRSGFQATKGALSVTGHRANDPERELLAFPKLVLEAFELESYAKAADIEPHGFERGFSLVTVGALLSGVVLGAWHLVLALGTRRALDPPSLALLSALFAWAPFLVLGLPSRHHYVETAVPSLVYLAAFALTRAAALGVFLAPVGWASVLAVAQVLASVEDGKIRAGSDYDLPIGEKTRACKELLQKELELARAPDRFEYLILLEIAWRELPEEERARFTLEAHHEALYWDVVYKLPRPKHPKGRAVISPSGTHATVLLVP